MDFDESYVHRLQNGDPEVEAHFATYFTRAVRLMLRRYLRSADLIQDACQETLLRALGYFRSGKSLVQPERLAGFVHTICSNVAMEMLRSQTRHPQAPSELPDAPDPRVDVMSGLVTGERKRIVSQVLSELPAKDRDLIRMAILEEADRSELCRRFNTTEDYLRVLIHRARLRFKNALLKDETMVKQKSQSARGAG